MDVPKSAISDWLQSVQRSLALLGSPPLRAETMYWSKKHTAALKTASTNRDS